MDVKKPDPRENKPSNDESHIAWKFLDPRSNVEVSHRRLPHWEQPGVCYFLTFRTADSLPSDVADDFRRKRHDWLMPHGIDTTWDDWHALIGGLPFAVQREYHRTWSREFHQLLDDCHGSCDLGEPDVAKIVLDALLYFDGVRYDLGDAVIMPNHVHFLVQFRPMFSMRKQCFSWKHYTSREINIMLNREGHFWQGETYDHIVRSVEEFAHYQRYIADNPARAGLRSGFVVHKCRHSGP